MGAFPKDAKQIYQYLTSVGYSPIAAAGILGNIGVEGPTGPESQGTGGAGLIGWTPPSAAFPITPIVTGNPTRDLHVQLTDLVAWGKRNNAAPGIMNSARTPAAAAALWETHAERAGVVVMAERQSIANQVYRAAKSGNWPSGGTPLGASNPTGAPTDITAGIFGDLTKPFLSALGVGSLGDFFERAGLVLGGLILIIIGLMQVARGGSYKDAVQAATPGGSSGSSSGSKSGGHRASDGSISDKSDAQIDREVREHKKKMGGSAGGKASGLGVVSRGHTVKSLGSEGPEVGAMSEVPF